MTNEKRWCLAKGRRLFSVSGVPTWLLFLERIKDPTNLFLRWEQQGRKKQKPKPRVFKYSLFILRAIDPEQCQMFGRYSKTKRTVRETGLARPARHQDFPRITEGKIPPPRGATQKNPSPALLLKVFSSQRHSNTSSSLEREGIQCRLPLRAEDPTLRWKDPQGN